MYSHDLIVQHLDGQHYNNLHPNMASMITYILGGTVVGNPVIRAGIISDNAIKPNIGVEVNNQTYYLSVLDGHGNSIHEEQPNDILPYIQSLGASQSVIDCIHDLCYSANHTTGFIQNERSHNPSRLTETEQFFYNNRTAIIDRALRTGTQNAQINTQYIYWGNVEHGYIRNIDEVIRILSNNHSNTSLIAIGVLALQRKDRFVNNSIQIKWHNPNIDLQRP